MDYYWEIQKNGVSFGFKPMKKASIGMVFDAFIGYFVDPKGFEPPTNRTGICHSIQLNYGSLGWLI